MFKFFRTIRHKLWQQGKVKGYLGYAVGEIALIVVGILIAVQINNWNEGRQNNVLRGLYLDSLIDESLENIQLLQDLNNFAEEDGAIINGIIGSVRASDGNIETLKQKARFDFKGMVFVKNKLNTNSIETLISTGDLKLLSPDLREQLLALKTQQQIYMDWYQLELESYLVLLDDFQQNFVTKGSNNSFGDAFNNLVWEQADPTKLIPMFTNLIDNKGRFHSLGTSLRAKLMEDIRSLVDELEALKREA